MSLLLLLKSAAGGPASITGTLTATLDTINSTASGTLGHVGTLSATLDDITSTASGTSGNTGSLTATLDGIGFDASGTVQGFPTKIGGDDVPTRVEIWEGREKPKKKRKKQPDEFIQEQLAAVAGMTVADAKAVLADDDEEMIFLLLTL